jgi:hypothetical protein
MDEPMSSGFKRYFRSFVCAFEEFMRPWAIEDHAILKHDSF